ncbi:Rieske [2Fe-2S] iron-sulfur domain-containing protein [Phlyctochytrium arcticum]|nr:Rieske [2Fe-2S] iron-sulfur domain-containing protein [Phlyctochytrium arcticum]
MLSTVVKCLRCRSQPVLRNAYVPPTRLASSQNKKNSKSNMAKQQSSHNYGGTTSSGQKVESLIEGRVIHRAFRSLTVWAGYPPVKLVRPLRRYAAPVVKASPETDTMSPPHEQTEKYVDPSTLESGQIAKRNAVYLTVGAFAALGAVAGKNIITNYVMTWAPSADVLALAKVEVAMASIPEGKNVVLKWRGKPVFIRHRTARDIEEARVVPLAELRDPERDEDRAKVPEWLVQLGVCTHLGCVPIGDAGEYGGWFCPCHGSHYDTSGRIRKGPAPLNLEIPPYEFSADGERIVIG